jgi:hypothetical protein
MYATNRLSVGLDEILAFAHGMISPDNQGSVELFSRQFSEYVLDVWGRRHFQPRAH